VEAIEAWAEQAGETCRSISAVTGQGLAELIAEVGRRLDEMRPMPEGREIGHD